MNDLEEIKQLYSEGKTEEQIKSSLKNRGLDAGEIDSNISQAQIKEAVDQPIQPEQERNRNKTKRN